jgi:hypothetical protein
MRVSSCITIDALLSGCAFSDVKASGKPGK